MNLLEKLSKPFDTDKIHWRVGATNIGKDGKPSWGDMPLGIPLAYVDSRDVMKRLDDVVGFDNWQCRYPFKGCCEIGIRIAPEPGLMGEWIWKSNGAGETQVEAEKGEFSDAFKRAAVLWGVARYLYAIKLDWQPIKKKGRSWVLEKKPNIPAWARPENYEAILQKKGES